MNFLVLPGQLRLALYLGLAGLASGLLYDLLWPLRRRRLLCPGADMAYGLLAGVLLSAALIRGGEEGVRPVGLLLYGAGLLLYRLGIGRGIRFCFRFFHGRKKQPGRRNENTEERQVRPLAEKREADHGGDSGHYAGDLRIACDKPAEWGYPEYTE